MSLPLRLVWFRNDLRLHDNLALWHAVESGHAVVPVVVWSPEDDEPWAPGAASRWWLHQSLDALDGRLREMGSRLIRLRGPAAVALAELARRTGAVGCHWNACLEPAAMRQEQEVREALAAAGVESCVAGEGTLFDLAGIRTGGGAPYQVFTPFWRRCMASGTPRAPRGAPAAWPSPAKWPPSESLEGLGLLPRHDWASGLRETWTPGEAGAHERLQVFMRGALEAYRTGRERPDWPGTSALSPHLHAGEISPHAVWHAVQKCAGTLGRDGVDAYCRQLVWREFALSMLHQFPRTVDEPLRLEYRAFPWRRDAASLRAWQRGCTGYPIVDAAMRQLWQTGWMHNRARMIVASFLVKDLLISWEAGARWFWDTLVDADLANNTLGWQWAGGCGADAAPYFRIFNPVKQGQTFDPDGAYVRRFVPELARLPAAHIHAPWEAPGAVLRSAGVTLGREYPAPLVEHGAARLRALDALKQMRVAGESVR
jgi:deoxyribodipyrimidine photo-lyase